MSECCDIAAIMPCRGRIEQTVRSAERLRATAGYDHERWTLIAVATEPEKSAQDRLVKAIHSRVDLLVTAPDHTYWQALADVTCHATDAPLLINLANDLLPGRDWLQRAHAAYVARFGDGEGIIGFNDGINHGQAAAHFLISRALLDRYGGWPVWYRHNYGDTELVERAKAEGLFAVAPWAVLYHDHHLTGAARDAVYAAGDATWREDERLFRERRRAGWPSISS